MRHCSFAATIMLGIGLSVLQASQAQAGSLDLDMWATPVNVQITGYAAVLDTQYDATIIGPGSAFGSVSRQSTVSQPSTVPNSNPSLYGTESYTTPSMSLVFKAHDSYGQLALDYRFEKSPKFSDLQLEVANSGVTDFTLALFIAKSAPVAGVATWSLASYASIDPDGPVLEEYRLATNYSQEIYGVLVVYNPRNDLLSTVPNSLFDPTALAFATNANSIEAELCCVVGVPEPSSAALALIAIGLVAVGGVRTRMRRSRAAS